MKCYLCNGGTIKQNPTFWDSSLYDKNRSSLYRCKNCGVVFVRPASSEEVNFYNLNADKANLNPLINFARYYTVHRWITYFLHNKGRILDFGCGKGEFVFYLRQKGWRAYGVDPLVKVTPPIQSSLYKDLLFSSLTGLHENNTGTFDAITLNFSLEHCDNPLLTLKELRTSLIPKGLIFIRVPNFNYILRNKKLSSFQVKIPLHRHFFTPDALADLLKSAGFTTLNIDTRFCITSALTVPCSIFPKLNPMEWLYDKRIMIRLKKGLILGTLSLIFTPYVLLKSLFGKGVVLHAVAQKSSQ